MAVLQVDFMSQSLMRNVPFQMILPNDLPPDMKADNKHYERPTKTLYLLHGFSGSTQDWLLGSMAQELAVKYNLAMIMPSGENSFYLNGKGTGSAYETYTGYELVNYVRQTFGLSNKKEDTYIGGLSMGGFGAIHTGLKYPETFCKMFGLSSALIVDEVIQMKPGSSDMIGDYDYYTKVFGNPEELENSDNNPEHLIRTRKKAGDTIQPIFLSCGREDSLLKNNQEFRDFLIKEEVDVTYKENPGIHDWNYWNQNLEPAVKWLLDLKEESR